MSNGSSLFSDKQPVHPHIVSGKTGGMPAEVEDLRRDVAEALLPLCALTIDEFTNPVAADAAGVKTSTATTAAAVTHAAASLVGGAAVTLSPPRNITVTCSDDAGTWVGNLTVNGVDINGVALTETIAFTNNALTAGLKCFARVDSLSRLAQNDANGNYTVGFGTRIGLSKKIKTRAAVTSALLEIMDAVVVGVFGGGATQTATNIAAATGVTIDSTVSTEMFNLGTPVLGAVDDTHVAFLGNDVGSSFPGPFTNPDVPRTVVATFEALWDGGDITLHGTNQFDAVVTEVLAANAGSTRASVNAYKTVTAAEKGAVGAAKFVKLGRGTGLGIVAVTVGGMGTVTCDGVAELGTWNSTYHTVVPTTAFNGTHRFIAAVNVGHVHTVTDATHNHTQNAHQHAAAGGTGGTFYAPASALPNGAYTPNTAPNATHDYALVYEYDPTA